MARQSKPRNPEVLRTELIELLNQFEELLESGVLREKVKHLVPANHVMRDLGASMVVKDDGTFESAGIKRMLIYLQSCVGEIVEGDELMVVSGIQDYPRRIRQLRVQLGWAIISGKTVKETYKAGDEFMDEGIDEKYLNMQPDQYALLSADKDREAADRWNEANMLRKRKDLTPKLRMLEYFKLNVGRAVTGEELMYVAGNYRNWQRRVRDLRTIDGWRIFTKMSGEFDLPPGSYMLGDLNQSEKHDRNIPDSVRVEVLIRDGSACRKCGWTPANRTEGDPRKFLELHHLKHHAKGGENVKNNLVTLCNVHHDDVHRLDKSKLWGLSDFEKWLAQ